MSTKNRCVGLLLAAAASLVFAGAVQAGTFAFTEFTGDSDSGISSAKTYTHLLDFNGVGTTINGVAFSALGSVTSGADWTTTGIDRFHSGSGGRVSGNSDSMLDNFVFNNSAESGSHTPMTLTLTGLTAGTTYTGTFYGLSWGGDRLVTVSTSDGATSSTYNENDYDGSLLSYTYTADSTSMTFTVASPGSSAYFMAGFTNEVVSAVPEPSTIVLLGCGLAALLAYAWRKRN